MNIFIKCLAVIGGIGVIAIGILCFIDGSVSINIENAYQIDGSIGKDSIAVAAQIGRLDLISLLMAFLGLAIAIMVVYSIVSVKSVAETVAKEQALNAVDKKMESDLPFILRGIVKNEIERGLKKRSASIELSQIGFENSVKEPET